MTLRDLSRAYRRALLSVRRPVVAAPLLLAACAAPTAKPNDVNVNTVTIATASASGSTRVVLEAPPKDASTEPDPACTFDKPNITGCGGAEVMLHASPAKCGLPADGDIPEARCKELCAGFETRSCRVYAPGNGGAPRVFCNAAHPCLGRLPSPDGRRGPRAGAGSRRDAVIAHLTIASRMEALSVDAFRELEADLARWGAPAKLLRDCRRAAADEGRHARAMNRLLRQRGITARSALPRTRNGFASLEALALHNEREGVVGETWGALVAAHQAAHASDPDVRREMRTIAGEETEHAALSFRIGAWARKTLGAEVSRKLDRTRRAAFDALRASPGPFPGDDPERTLGWPSPAESAALLGALAPLFGDANVASA